jgi:hypothetical protein
MGNKKKMKIKRKTAMDTLDLLSGVRGACFTPMIRVIGSFSALLLLLTAPASRADTNRAVNFQEVYELVRTHLPGSVEADINQVAVKGLLSELKGKVSIAGAEGASNASLLAKPASIIDEGVAFVRIEQVADGLVEKLSDELRTVKGTNQLSGVVLDLRFAEGHSYKAAAQAANLFTTREGVLLDWGSGPEHSKSRSDAITLPVAVLVNRETSGAAEALAAVLRQTGAGLILGSTTSGAAMAMREFPLKNGDRLLIATTPVTLADGTVLSSKGVTPDIQVTVSEDAEKRYFEDAFAELAANSATAETNRPPRRTRLSEADLVRERREGRTNASSELPLAPERQFGKPLIQDPALARAVDLLKGLAVVRGARS